MVPNTHARLFHRCSSSHLNRGGLGDFEYNGMVGAMAHVIAVGRVKLYGVDRAGAGLSPRRLEAPSL
jgi:hypothetical protein